MGDRFGASDAWLMFFLWAAAEGHIFAAVIAFAILTLYTVSFSSPRRTEKKEGSPNE